MKKSRFTDEQIVTILRKSEAGTLNAELRREHADEKAARRTGAVNRWLQKCTLKKVLTTSQKRAAVAAFEEVGLSERKACIAVGLSRATLGHKSTKKHDSALRNLIIEIAHARRRFGYERITWLLKLDGQ